MTGRGLAMASENEVIDAVKKLGRPRRFYELTAEEQNAALKQVCKLLTGIEDSVAYIAGEATYFNDGRAQFAFAFSHKDLVATHEGIIE